MVATTDRQAIEHFIAQAATVIRTPVASGRLTVEISPYAGVSILGRDAATTKGLVNTARIAAGEAHRTGSCRARFFSDTMKLKSLARLDIGRELRAAIDTRSIRTRHVGRYELASGRLVASVAYVRWRHPLRGDVSPREFLGVADSTGGAIALSQCVLETLGNDYALMRCKVDESVRVSYGPLRHHLLQEEFLNDIEQFLDAGKIPASHLEIRIPENTFVVLPPALSEGLAAMGLQVVVDEVGRGMSSLEKLARSPVWGMQLDRASVEALRNDEIARRICQAGIASAAALGIAPIAIGVDDEQQREALVALGCRFGSGDLYANQAHRSWWESDLATAPG